MICQVHIPKIVLSPHVCMMCFSSLGTNNCLLLHFEVALYIWNKLLGIFGHLVIVNSLGSSLCFFLFFGGFPVLHFLLYLMFSFSTSFLFLQ